MKIIKHHSTVYNIQFKKVKLWIDHNLAIFLNYTDNDCLNISSVSNDFLLKKFDLYDWDDIGENLLHIKFLVKYSPILSKLINVSEFNEIEFVDLDCLGWQISECSSSYYLFFGGNKAFIKLADIAYSSKKHIKLNIEPEFKKFLIKNTTTISNFTSED